MPFKAQADRIAPAVIKPISKDGTTFDQEFHADKNGFAVFILAKKGSGGSPVWKTQIYSREFDQKLETDVQEIYLKSLSLKGTHLIAVDERKQIYELDSASGKLLKPTAPVVYPK